jgi:hypothetical protein
MNNGNFFPNYDNNTNNANNTSLNMMNMQSMNPTYVEPQNEMVMPTPNNIINNPMPVNNGPQVEMPTMNPNPFDFSNMGQPQTTMDQGFFQPSMAPSTQNNLNNGFVEPTPMEQPVYQPSYVEPVEPVIIQETPIMMQDTPLFNPTAFEVPVTNTPVAEENKLEKLQELLNSNGYTYKVYSNETDNCVIVELPKN